MSYSNDWNFNDDSVHIPHYTTLSVEDIAKREIEVSEKYKSFCDKYKAQVLKVLVQVDKLGYDGLVVRFGQSSIEKVYNGRYYVQFNSVRIGEESLHNSMFDFEVCADAFGGDADQVETILKTLLATKINKLIKDDIIVNHSSVSAQNIGDIDSYSWGTGLTVEIV